MKYAIIILTCLFIAATFSANSPAAGCVYVNRSCQGIPSTYPLQAGQSFDIDNESGVNIEMGAWDVTAKTKVSLPGSGWLGNGETMPFAPIPKDVLHAGIIIICDDNHLPVLAGPPWAAYCE